MAQPTRCRDVPRERCGILSCLLAIEFGFQVGVPVRLRGGPSVFLYQFGLFFLAIMVRGLANLAIVRSVLGVLLFVGRRAHVEKLGYL